MKIIVTEHLPARSAHEWRESGKWKYQARTWQVTDNGHLEIYSTTGRLIATHAAGTWAHVHGSAESQQS